MGTQMFMERLEGFRYTQVRHMNPPLNNVIRKSVEWRRNIAAKF